MDVIIGKRDDPSKIKHREIHDQIHLGNPGETKLNKFCMQDSGTPNKD